MRLARDLRISSIAFPAMGTGVGGLPIDEAARVTVTAVRAELPQSPLIDHVTFAMRGAAAYEAFQTALAEGDETHAGGGASVVAAGGSAANAGTPIDGALRA
jgi:O-acetyl-ADP-ribose deacetylase (regulator of RNase III)